MFDKERLYNLFFLIVFMVIGAIFILDPLASPTGVVVYQQNDAEKVWDFANASEYEHNSSLLVNDTIQLKSTSIVNIVIIEEINESSLVSATEYEEGEEDDDDDSKNVTEKVQTLGQGHVQLKESESVLELKLASQLQNNDVLSVYLLSGTTASGKVYLCKSKAGCNAGAYGSITLPENILGWYNITLSGLSVANDVFFVASPDKLKIDMVKGYQKSTRNETTTSTSYPSSAFLQTADLQPTDWKNWEMFSTVDQLNGQQVQYEYSTNSGSLWNTVPADSNLSSVTENKIRFRITLTSNTTATPLVDSIKISYTLQPSCVENWVAQDGSCLANDSQLRSYADINECGTSTSLPSDNGTDLGCDYCDLFNCSQSVIEESVAEVRGNKTVYIVDAVAEANIRLELEAANSSSVEIIEYGHNIKNETPSSKPLGKYVAIESSETVSSVTIILYYNDTEITTANIYEETIHIHYYNETSHRWEVLPSLVNMAGNYVSTTVPHLSLYGLFAESQNSADSSVSSTQVSGVSGGGTKSQEANLKESIPKVSEIVLPVQSHLDSLTGLVPVSESSCDYVIEMSLPDEIVLKENEFYQGEMVNKGNCEIADLKLGLSKELQPEADLSLVGSLSLEPGNKTNFRLIRKKMSNNDLFSTTSYAISSLRAGPVSGQIILEGYDNKGDIFRRELPVKIILKNAFPWKELSIASLIIATLSLLLVRSFYPRKRERKGIKKKTDINT